MTASVTPLIPAANPALPCQLLHRPCADGTRHWFFFHFGKLHRSGRTRGIEETAKAIGREIRAMKAARKPVGQQPEATLTANDNGRNNPWPAA